MGVMACDRKYCESIMCDRYNSTYGYICYECMAELKEKKILNIEEFMRTPKIDKELEIDPDNYEEEIDRIFSKD